MPSDNFRQLVVTIGVRAKQDKPSRLPAWHETLGALILGTLSTLLGAAVLAGLLMQTPSFDITVTACVGQWLGVAGIFLAKWVKSRLASLSILGTALCLVPLAHIYLALFAVTVALMFLATICFFGVRAFMEPPRT